MNEEERDKCLIEIRVTMARMRTDIYWLKRLITAAAILTCACLGIQLPDIFIQA